MYDFIRGRLTQRGPDEVVLDVGGVGYELSVSGATAGRLPAVGSEATLFVHDRIKEERAVLYGFASREERQLFLKLLTVSRIGPGIAQQRITDAAPALRRFARQNRPPLTGRGWNARSHILRADF